MTATLGTQLGEEVLRRFAATLRSWQLYSTGHPIITRNLESLVAAIAQLHALEPSIILGLVGDELVVNDMPLSKAESYTGLVKRLKQAEVERVTIDCGVTSAEIAAFVERLSIAQAQWHAPQPTFPELPHIR